MKYCSKCKEHKPLTEFSKNSSSPDGLQSWCKDCSRSYLAEWRKGNPEYHTAWREDNPEKVRESSRNWRKAHPGKNRAEAMKRHANKLRRTPPWADLVAIREVYIACPEGHHVDHIIPLQGKTVSGLHVLENLQYLPIEENLSKSNSFESKIENMRKSNLFS